MEIMVQLGASSDSGTSNSCSHFYFVTCRFNNFNWLGKLQLLTKQPYTCNWNHPAMLGNNSFSNVPQFQKIRLELVELKHTNLEIKKNWPEEN